MQLHSSLSLEKEKAQKQQELNEEQPANIAEYFEELTAEKQLFIFRLLSKDVAAEVFSYMDNDTQEHIVQSITDREVRNIVDEMFLENIEEKDIPAYLKEIGKMNLLLGVLFVGKACLDIPFPGSRPILYGWLLILLLCVFSISKIDTKYKK